MGQGHRREVTFEDMRNGTGKGKLGYNKIRFCGEQRPGKMAYDIFGLTPAVSTRKSTPKLHALSIPCFAGTGGQLNAMYLSDVPSLARDVASETPQQPWEIDFRQSKWSLEAGRSKSSLPQRRSNSFLENASDFVTRAYWGN
jgi:hypothetical protein